MLSLPDFAAAVSLFPTKLYRMVSDTQCRCMQWGGDGEHLIINTREFEDELLQETVARWKYQLKTTSTTSFIRQLHAYGFRKVIDANVCEIGSPREPSHIRRYFHPYFHRDRPDLLVFMKRGLRSQTSKRPTKYCTTEDSSNAESVKCIQGISSFEENHRQFESPQKRRRKTRPKRHPSFDLDCTWDDDADMSPPTMVPRPNYLTFPLDSNFRGEKLRNSTKHEQAEDDHFHSHLQVKEELRDSAEGATEYYSPTTEKKMSLNNKNGAVESYGDAQPGDDAMVEGEDLVSESDDSEERVETIQEQAGQEKENVVDQPLDLSRAAATHTTIANTPLPATVVQGMNVGEVNNQFSLPTNTTSFALPPNNVIHPMQQQHGLSNAGTVTFCQVPSQPSYPLPRMIAPGAPFPFASTMTNLQYAFLQPAYIAWPARRMFCPQTKQWIQPRPHVIPLPFKNQFGQQQLSPGKTELHNPRPTSNFSYGMAKWNAETPRALMGFPDPKNMYTSHQPASLPVAADDRTLQQKQEMTHASTK